MLLDLALPLWPDMYASPLQAPALTPTVNGKRIPLSMKQSSTPQVKTPLRPPPSSTSAVLSPIVILFSIFRQQKYE
jgi:hypothetical protein